MNKLGGNLLQDAERLLREGKRLDAYPLLVEYIQHHPASARGWWMISLTVTDLKQQIDCMERVLNIDPKYTPACARLERLKGNLASQSLASPFVKSPVSDSDPIIDKRDVTPRSAPPSRRLTSSRKKNNLIMRLGILSVLACTAIGILGFMAVLMFQGGVLLSPIAKQPLQTTLTLDPVFSPEILRSPTWTPTVTLIPLPNRPAVTVIPFPTNIPLSPVPTLALKPSSIPESSIGPSTGLFAPDFTLKNISNNKVNLSDYKGHPVIIFFWATWCPYCESEMSSMQKVYTTYKDYGLVILAIDVGENAGKARTYCAKHNLTFPILNDSGKDISAKYRVSGFPTHFFVDSNRRISSIVVGITDYGNLSLQARALLNVIQ